MNYLVSSEEEFFNIKKRNYISIYTENFELFCLLKNQGIKYLFSKYLYKKSKNSDQIIDFFSKNWYLDNKNNDIFDLEKISISKSINRRLSIQFTYILRAYISIQSVLKKKQSLKISSNSSKYLLLVSNVFKQVEIINFDINKKSLFLSHSPDRARGFVPKTFLLGKLLRILQKFFIKEKVIYFSDNTSVNSAKKNKQILIQNSKNIFNSFYFCENDFLFHKYQKIVSKIINNYDQNLIRKNIIKILNRFSIYNKSANDISKIFLLLLKKEFNIQKKILIRSMSLYQDLFSFYKPKSVIQNGESGFDNILIAEFSRKNKIKNFLLIDGYQFFVDDFIFFKNKYKNQLSFNKVFAYGSSNEIIYLKQGFKKKQIIKINSPILDKRININRNKFEQPLILGYQPNLNCYQTPFDVQIKIELDLIRLLQDMEFKDIIIKLKHGDERLNGIRIKTPIHYKKLFENYFNKEMTINLNINSENLLENFKKTKFVIGGFSTSIIEAISSKVPYYFYEPIESGYKKKVLDTIELFDKDKIAVNLLSLKKNINSRNFIPFKMKNLAYSKSLHHFNFK
jgi:hypothetical protein